MDIRIRRINNGYLVTAGFMDGLEWYFKRFDDAIDFLQHTGKKLTDATTTDDIEEVMR